MSVSAARRGPTVGEAIQEYVLAMEIEGKSPATLRWYTAMLTPLLECYGPRLLEGVTSMLVRQYCAGLKARRWDDSTYSAHVRVAKQWSKWCSAEWRLPDPMANIKTPRVPHKLPDVISMAAARRLIDACDYTPLGRRNRAILYFLLDTGCRVSGLCGLRVDDLHIVERYALLREKGKKERYAPFSRATAGQLAAWEHARPRGARTAFCAMRERDRGAPLTENALRLMLQKLAQKAQVDGPVNPHAFRHLAALTMRKNGADVGVVAQILGHADVRTTIAIYGQFTNEALVELHQRFSPIQGLERTRHDHE